MQSPSFLIQDPSFVSTSNSHRNLIEQGVSERLLVCQQDDPGCPDGCLFDILKDETETTDIKGTSQGAAIFKQMLERQQVHTETLLTPGLTLSLSRSLSQSPSIAT